MFSNYSFFGSESCHTSSVKMSSGVIEIIEPLQNITETCVSPIKYTPQYTIKKFELLYVREYRQGGTWNKGLFQ